MKTQHCENPLVDILLTAEEQPEWLVPDVFLAGTLIILIGESGAGKSFLTYCLGLAAATGLPALSNLVRVKEPKRILYFDQENARQNRNKYIRRAWEGLTCKLNKERKYDALELAIENFWPMHMELGTDEWADVVAAGIQQVQPHLVVFDTATSCFGIEDENNNSEATSICNTLRNDLMTLCDPMPTVLILKHAKTRTEAGQIRTMRGAKTWKDNADQTLFQVKTAGRPMQDNLSRTRMMPDKNRAYGLDRNIYITPAYTDENKTGLTLAGSYAADKEHKRREKIEEGETE